MDVPTSASGIVRHFDLHGIFVWKKPDLVRWDIIEFTNRGLKIPKLGGYQRIGGAVRSVHMLVALE